MDFMKIWAEQDISDAMESAIKVTAELVHGDIMHPRPGVANISEWCKQDDCWERLQARIGDLETKLPAQFIDGLLPINSSRADTSEAAPVTVT